MKKILLLTSVLILAAGLYAFRQMRHCSDILKELGISPQEATQLFATNLQEGILGLPSDRYFLSYPKNKRARAVAEIGNLIKRYTQSVDYARMFASLQERAREWASEPELIGGYKACLQKRKQLEAKLAMAKDEELEETYLQLSLLQDELTHGAWMKALLRMQKPSDLTVYRLEQFLALTDNMPFDARLVKSGGKLVFVDPELERKGADWKMCFRSGAETIISARQYAQNWLKELGAAPKQAA